MKGRRAEALRQRYLGSNPASVRDGFVRTRFHAMSEEECFHDLHNFADRVRVDSPLH